MTWLAETEIAPFWAEKEQTGLDPDTTQGLVSEGAASQVGLVEFKKEQVEMLDSTLRKPKGDRMSHPDQEKADPGKTTQSQV